MRKINVKLTPFGAFGAIAADGGSNELFGGPGNDNLSAYGGGNTLFAGSGNDSARCAVMFVRNRREAANDAERRLVA